MARRSLVFTLSRFSRFKSSGKPRNFPRMKVPLLDVPKQNNPLAGELTAAFERVLKSGMYIMGPELTKFEEAAAVVCGAKHGIGVSSGTDALLLALMALGVGDGDEVLLPAFTFFATAGSVHRVGATPVWCDSDPHTYNIDLADAAAKCSPKTRAIIPVHLFGQACDMDAVMAFAKEKNLFVIEDTAQSMGAKWKGRPVGGIGHFGATSFFPSKNLGGLGDSGLVSVNDDALAEKARILRVHGMQPKYYHKYVGANFRMDPLQAALLAVKLPHLKHYNGRRAANAQRYAEALTKFPGVALNKPGAPADAKLLVPVDFTGEGIWNQFTLRVPHGRRDALKAHLAAREIGCDVYYPLTLDKQECFVGVGRGADKLPVAHKLSEEVLSIPVFPELEPAQQDAVIVAIGEWLTA